MAACCTFDGYEIGDVLLSLTSSSDPTCNKYFTICEICFDTLNNGALTISQGTKSVSLSVADQAATGLDIDTLIAAIEENCAGSIEPIIEPIIDTEVVCVEENDALYLLCVDKTDPLAPVITLKDIDGNEVTGLTPTKCLGLNIDTEKEFYCIDGLDFTRNDIVVKDAEGALVSINTFWQDTSGNVIADPTIDATKVSKGVCQIIVRTEPIEGCFTPTDTTINPVGITIHYSYNEDGLPFQEIYTLASDPTNELDIATYLGGGTISVGCCPVKTFTGSESRFCYDPDGGTNYRLPAIFKMCSDGTFMYVDQNNNEVTNLGCCKCCDTFCGNQWVDCNGNCISLSC